MRQARGKKLREIKKETTARLCREAYSQDGCLTETELAVMLKMSRPTVGNYLREYEAEHKTVLPRRGTIYDMGPTLTHKKIIIERGNFKTPQNCQSASLRSDKGSVFGCYLTGSNLKLPFAALCEWHLCHFLNDF